MAHALTKLRKCSRCGEGKPLSCFDEREGRRDGHIGICETCVSLQRNSYYKENADRILAYHKERHRNDPRISLLKNARYRAAKCNVPFALVIDDIIVPPLCPLLWIPIEIGSGKSHAGSPTIDRIRPELGYAPANIWVISHRANLLKNDGTLEELELLLRNMKFLIGIRNG